MGKMTEKEIQATVDEIEWIPKDVGDLNAESSWQKLKRKCRETPTVPLGLIATISALSYGLYNFYHGRKMMQQYSMRARVTFQGVTLVAIAYSIYKEGQTRTNAKEEKRREEKS